MKEEEEEEEEEEPLVAFSASKLRFITICIIYNEAQPHFRSSSFSFSSSFSSSAS